MDNLEGNSNSLQIQNYNNRAIIEYGGTLYLINKFLTTGVPGQSPEYTMLENLGEPLSVTTYDPANASSYVPGQIVIDNGVMYIVQIANPNGSPSNSDSFSPINPATTASTDSGYSFSVNPGYQASGNGQVVHNNEAVYIATRTPDRLKVTIEKSDPTGAAVWIDAVTESTGVPVALQAAQYAMRTSGGKYSENTILPYQTLIQQPDDGSIQMDDRTLVIENSGNYLINMSVTSIDTTGVPNIHAVVDDNGGSNGTARHRDIDMINVLSTGMCSSSLLVPIQGPGRLYLQVQGTNTPSFTTPGNAPQGQLSITKIA